MHGARAEGSADEAKRVLIDASDVGYCAGQDWRLELQRRGSAEISGHKPGIATLLEPFAKAQPKEDDRRAKDSTIEALGRIGADLARDIYDQISFLGQIAVITLKVMRRPHELRWVDVWNTYERAGVQALVVSVDFV